MARNPPARPNVAATRNRPSRRGGAGGTLIGVFIGLVLGLSLAAGVAYYLMKSNGPFPAQGGKEAVGAREAAKVAKADPSAEKPRFDFYKILPGGEEAKGVAEARRTPDRVVVDQAKDRTAEKAADKGREKSVMLPEKDATTTKAATLPKAATPDKVASTESTPATKPPERFWIQAGSFAAEPDAENLKARLAFAGWQASVQQGTIPDKGTRYRVRLGPYDNTDELNRIKSDLAKNGFEVAIIKF